MNTFFNYIYLMSNLKAGVYIKSTASLIGSFFEHTTILIVKHNDTGSIGFVANKPFEKSLHDLTEFNHIEPFHRVCSQQTL